jgi:formamidopyrimidine-DNA glycosylase
MPELPEVKVEAERLTERWGGRRLTKFSALSVSALKTFSPPYTQAYGRPLDSATNRGKWLLLHFGDLDFIVHLMQGGRLRAEAKRTARPRGGLARWEFDQGDPLLFTEAGTEHRAGIWTAERGETIEPMVGLGPDADQVSEAEFGERLRAGSGRIHNRLRDQTVVAGIGRRLANEICFGAALSPFTPTKSLTDEQVHALWSAMREAIDDSLGFERQQAEMVASNRRHSKVHHRAGEPCVRCGDAIRTVEYTTHTVFYCAPCQTAGKPLADNTTSKFLK